MKFKVRLSVLLKDFILDPEGRSVGSQLQDLGYREVSEFRMGKDIRFVMESPSRVLAEERVKKMCDSLLVNPLMEDVEISISELTIE